MLDLTSLQVLTFHHMSKMSKILQVPDDVVKVIDDLAGPSALSKSCMAFRFTIGLRHVTMKTRMCQQHIDAIADLGNIKALEILKGMDVQLAAAVAAQMPQLTSLNLDLWNNHIGDAGAQSLSAFSQMPQLTSLNLNLSHNQIGAAGAERRLINKKSVRRTTIRKPWR